MDPLDPPRERADLAAGARLDLMRSRSVPPQVPPRRAVFAWALTAALLAFALGLIANPWFERSVRSHLPGFAPTVAPTMADLAALDARLAALEARRPAAGAVAGPDAGAGERLARVEATVATLGATVPAANARADRIATDLAALTGRIDAGAAASTAALTSATRTADRAQAMLVLADVRRQLAAGLRLGGLEPALRRSFPMRGSGAIEAVAALGAAPVTLTGLRAGLEALRPALTGATAAPAATRSWWQGLRDSLAGIVVRSGSSASGTEPSARFDRATRALAAGNAAVAGSEIAALPPAARLRAQGWLAANDRFIAGWHGLGQLEATQLDPASLAP